MKELSRSFIQVPQIQSVSIFSTLKQGQQQSNAPPPSPNPSLVFLPFTLWCFVAHAYYAWLKGTGNDCCEDYTFFLLFRCVFTIATRGVVWFSFRWCQTPALKFTQYPMRHKPYNSWACSLWRVLFADSNPCDPTDKGQKSCLTGQSLPLTFNHVVLRRFFQLSNLILS